MKITRFYPEFLEIKGSFNDKPAPKYQNVSNQN
jgi:hypothetical protein